MPIKKNGMPFEAYPGPNKDDDGQKLLFAKPARGRRMTLTDLENYCTMGYAVRNGDLSRVFQIFIDVASKFMSQGYTIETPVGLFEPKLAMKRPVVNPDDVRHDDVEFDGIQFRVSKSFKKKVKLQLGSDGFRYVRKPSSTRLMANEEHLQKALQKSINVNNGYTTVADFAYYSGLTVYSARKILNKWCYGEHPRLKTMSYGRTTVYIEV